jgi:hypothetical protein
LFKHVQAAFEAQADLATVPRAIQILSTYNRLQQQWLGCSSTMVCLCARLSSVDLFFQLEQEISFCWNLFTVQ